jgi:hypothetical protein
MRIVRVVVCVATALVLCGTAARAQLYGSVCYKAKDSDKIVDTPSSVTEAINAGFPLESGCTISSTKLYCAAAAISGTLTVNGVPSVGTGFVSPIMDRIFNVPFGSTQVCYKVKCKTPPIPPVTSLGVTDPFAARTLNNLKASLICLPAQEGTTNICGDGAVTGSEECDPNGGPACPNGGFCEKDCKCHCEAACCYSEDPGVPALGCVEDTGVTSDIVSFMANCAALNPAPGLLFDTAASGPCTTGPLTGLPCNSGTPSKWLPAGACY